MHIIVQDMLMQNQAKISDLSFLHRHVLPGIYLWYRKIREHPFKIVKVVLSISDFKPR